MKYLALILVVGFLAVSVFGFAAMNHGPSGCDSGITGMITVDCPQALASMALHHIAAYVDFTEVTVSYVTILILLGMIAMAGIVSQFAQRAYSSVRSSAIPGHFLKRESYDYFLPLEHRLLGWLSHTEHKPAA